MPQVQSQSTSHNVQRFIRWYGLHTELMLSLSIPRLRNRVHKSKGRRVGVSRRCDAAPVPPAWNLSRVSCINSAFNSSFHEFARALWMRGGWGECTQFSTSAIEFAKPFIKSTPPPPKQNVRSKGKSRTYLDASESSACIERPRPASSGCKDLGNARRRVSHGAGSRSRASMRFPQPEPCMLRRRLAAPQGCS